MGIIFSLHSNNHILGIMFSFTYMQMTLISPKFPKEYYFLYIRQRQLVDIFFRDLDGIEPLESTHRLSNGCVDFIGVPGSGL